MKSEIELAVGNWGEKPRTIRRIVVNQYWIKSIQLWVGEFIWDHYRHTCFRSQNQFGIPWIHAPSGSPIIWHYLETVRPIK